MELNEKINYVPIKYHFVINSITKVVYKASTETSNGES